MTTIYALCDPGGEVRYIGRTRGTLERRIGQHLRWARLGLGGERKVRWLRGLLDAGYLPPVKILAVVPDERGAARERLEILRHRRCDLVNTLVPGGRVAWPSMAK